MSATRRLLIGLFAAFLPAATMAADTARDPLSYGIYRNDEQIGSSRVTFSRDGDRLMVETVIEIVVKVAYIPVYRQNELKREFWRNGVMVAYTADLDRNGTKSAVRAKANGTTLEAEGPAGKTKAPLGLMPSTYWSGDTVRQTKLLDSTTGAVANVAVTALGMGRAKTAKGEVDAKYYRMTGDLVRELWYDTTGALVALRFKESGGSVIEYRRH